MGREKGSPRNALVDSPSVWMGSDVTEHLGVTAWFVCFSVAPARAGTRVCEHKTVYRNDATGAPKIHNRCAQLILKNVPEEERERRIFIMIFIYYHSDSQKSAKMTGLSRSDRSHTLSHTHRRCRHSPTAFPQLVSNQPDSTRVCADTVSSHR